MELGGYTGNILKINLSTGAIEKEKKLPYKIIPAV